MESLQKKPYWNRALVLRIGIALAFLTAAGAENSFHDVNHDHTAEFPPSTNPDDDCQVRVIDVIPKDFSDFGITSVGTERNVTFLLNYTCPGYANPHVDDIFVHAHLDNDWVACIRYTSPLKETHDHNNKTMPPLTVDVNVVGSFVGFAHLELQMSTNYDKEGKGRVTKTLYSYPIVIHRNDVKIDTIFIYVVSVLVVINNVIMGCQLELAVIWLTLKKPLGPLVGFLCQFLIMPLLSFTAASVLLPDGLSKLGLFTLGCSPGGANSNFWTILFDGDINLSVTMTAISTVAAMGMMPLWLSLVSPWLYGSQDNYTPTIPFVNLIASIFSLTLPLLVGVLLTRCTPRARKVSNYVIKPFTIILVAFVLTMGVYSNAYVFQLLTWQMMLAGSFVALFGFVLGALGAFMARLPLAQIKAVSIETALQNAGIAMIVLKLSLPRPASDLAVASPTAQLLMTGPPMWIGLIILKIVRCLKGKSAATVTEVEKGDSTKEGETATGKEEENTGKGNAIELKDAKNAENGVEPAGISNPAFQRCEVTGKICGSGKNCKCQKSL